MIKFPSNSTQTFCFHVPDSVVLTGATIRVYIAKHNTNIRVETIEGSDISVSGNTVIATMQPLKNVNLDGTYQLQLDLQGTKPTKSDRITFVVEKSIS